MAIPPPPPGGFALGMGALCKENLVEVSLVNNEITAGEKKNALKGNLLFGSKINLEDPDDEYW